MIAILHTELVYSTAMATLLALTLTLNRLIARFAPARRGRQQPPQRNGGPMYPPHFSDFTKHQKLIT
jgi:hypothetical protein